MLEATWFYWGLKCSVDARFTFLVYEPASKYIPLQLCDSRKMHIFSKTRNPSAETKKKRHRKKIHPSVFFTGFLLRSGFAGQEKKNSCTFLMMLSHRKPYSCVLKIVLFFLGVRIPRIEELK